MSCCTPLTCSVLFISMILFNILFWNDHWSYSENDSQGIWDLCFKAGGYSCCQSFSDRGEDTPDWFIHFQIALYSACFSVAVTMILLPYWITLKRDNGDKLKAEECVAMLLITACFTSAICLSIASWKYGSNFKSVDSLEYQYLHTSFWIAGVCGMFYSFVGIGMTLFYIHRRGRAGYCCRCFIICGKALITVTGCCLDGCISFVIDGCVGGCRRFVNGCCAMKCRRREARRASTDHIPKSVHTVGNNALYGIAQFSRDNVQYSSTGQNNPISHNAVCRDNVQYSSTGQSNPILHNTVLHDSENRQKKETQEVFKRRWDGMLRSVNLNIVELDINRANHRYEYNEIEKAFLRNNNGFSIIQISRIQNCRLYAAHMHFKDLFMETAKIFHPQSYRKLLWHGTSEEATKNINSYGFNRNYQGKNACLYGDGVYFATKPSYSCHDKYSVPDSNGIKRVYLCSVFVGRYTKGKEGMKDPPKDGNGARYDSTVDDLKNPQIHVSFFDNQAYAQYLILFSKEIYYFEAE